MMHGQKTIKPAGTVAFRTDDNEYRHILMRSAAVNCAFCKCYEYVKFLSSATKTPLNLWLPRFGYSAGNKMVTITQRQNYYPCTLLSDWPQYTFWTEQIFLYHCFSLTPSTIVLTVFRPWCRNLSLHVSLSPTVRFLWDIHTTTQILYFVLCLWPLYLEFMELRIFIWTLILS
jgi:hypothetical protein